MMPLTMAKAGETVTIKKITGKDEVRLHLAELGFVVGSDVTVVNEIAGNLIVQVKCFMSSLLSALNTIVSSIRFKNSGLNIRRTSSMTLFFIRS